MLVCSYEFGRNLGAEGICTERLVKAVLEAGRRVTVATSHHSQSHVSHPAFELIQVPDRPGTFRISAWLARYAGFYLELGFSWRRKVTAWPKRPQVDFIYGRSMPFTSVLAAAALAAHWQKPLGIHFSDPVPGPWEQRDRVFRAKLRAVRRVIQQSAFVTFVTEQAQQYTERLLNVSLSEKAFILPHIAPEPVGWEEPQGNRTVFLYAGRFYGRRRPDDLLQGFQMLRREVPPAEFHYVGPDAEWIMQLAMQRQLGAAVQVFPYTQDIQRHYALAHVLVATDANDDPPVYLTTKIIEYLNTNRKVLLVSPENSAGSKLVGQFPATALRVAENPQAICQGMRCLAGMRPSAGDFEKRLRGMHFFSSKNMGELFLRQSAARLGLRTDQRFNNPPGANRANNPKGT